MANTAGDIPPSWWLSDSFTNLPSPWYRTPCPSCGYCPTCGRRRDWANPTWIYPYTTYGDTANDQAPNLHTDCVCQA